MGRAIITIPMEHIVRSTGIGKVKVHSGARYNMERDTIEVVIEHPSFPDADAGAQLPRVACRMTFDRMYRIDDLPHEVVAHLNGRAAAHEFDPVKVGRRAIECRQCGGKADNPQHTRDDGIELDATYVVRFEWDVADGVLEIPTPSSNAD